MGVPLCRRCGHPQSWHRHYRAGTDCSPPKIIGWCNCARFKRQWFRLVLR